ncbi:substrate-binding domain-containing protein [Ruania alba]|uniref:DNA-binding transcriptional regulator, LacI/PurR family n=1 Tax=Ruania alba TaxID=648782 RepID=A0A1H5HLM7_9MICO|nr:substrate-binding domain-containing protein [Ruania alba]SEE28922.1 DNA-binding transcriptional regulator, LacI/PurR family [Ruania alba]
MTRASTLVIRPGEHDRVRELAESGRTAQALRARAVLLAAEGCSHTEIAQRLAVSRQSVVTWRRRYEESGLAGLDDRDRSGRPAVIDPWAAVQPALVPAPHGKRWSSRSLAAHLDVSPATVSRAWRAHGFTPVDGGAVRLGSAPPIHAAKVELVGIHAAGPFGVAAFRSRNERRSVPARRGPGDQGLGPADVESGRADPVAALPELLESAAHGARDPELLHAFLRGHDDCELLVTPGVAALGVYRCHSVGQWQAMVRVLAALHGQCGGPRLELSTAPTVLGSTSRRPTSSESAQVTPRVTMREVAADAGVSIKTVSNVLTGAKKVESQTRGRVEAAIDRLGYQVNTAARQLRTGRRGQVVLAVPEFRVNYFAELAEQLIDAGAERDVNILVQMTRGRRERELEIVAAARGLADGVIMVAQGMSEGDLPELSASGAFVLLGENVSGASVDHITISNADAARTAMEHLLAAGRRQVVLLGLGSSPVSAARVRGCRAAAASYGLQLDNRLLVPAGPWHRDAGERAMLDFLDRGVPFDAIVGFNDELALGAARALLTHGVHVPSDVAIVGFDDSEDAAYSTPSITSIAPDMAHIARRALELIDERQRATRTRAPVQVTAPYTLAVRESAP